MTMEGNSWEKMFWGWKEKIKQWQKEWQMVSAVMMTLVRWDDRGEEMNQVEADQDVVDEVSEEVDSRGKVTHSERNDW